MKKITTEQLQVAPILDRQVDQYPELVASLEGEQATSADMLLSSALLLLDQNGTDSTVNGISARVTEDYALVQLGAKDYRARVAQIGERKRGRQSQTVPQTLIVFDEDEDVQVRTGSPFAITFRDFGGNTDLVVANSMDPLVGDERYAKLVQDILATIGEKVLQRRQNTPSPLQELRGRIPSRKTVMSRLHGYFNSNQSAGYRSFFETIGDRRRFIRGALGITALLYTHAPFTNSDATLATIPMPLPVEVLVDLSNMPDHRATGFDAPVGATRLVIGQQPARLALLPDYDANGAPDTTYTALDGIQYNESKPGLYSLTVPETDRTRTAGSNERVELTNPSTGCYDIRANTSGGRTLVFTQSPHLVEQVTVQAVSAESIEVCPVEGVELDSLIEGKIYFFQS